MLFLLSLWKVSVPQGIVFSAGKEISFFRLAFQRKRERKLLFPFNHLNVNLVNLPLLFMAYFL